jgi:hypothetical protein
MPWIRFVLIALALSACAPAMYDSSDAATSSLTDAITDGRDDTPVWSAERGVAQVVALETVRGFDSRFHGAYVKPVRFDTKPVFVDEISSDALDGSRATPG